MQKTIHATILIAMLVAACAVLAVAGANNETLCNQGSDSTCEALDRKGYTWIADSSSVPWDINDDQGCGYLTNPNWVECQVQGVNGTGVGGTSVEADKVLTAGQIKYRI